MWVNLLVFYLSAGDWNVTLRAILPGVSIEYRVTARERWAS